MATFSHPDCVASWQGNYFAKDAGPNGSPAWHHFSLNVTAAQAVQNSIFKMCKLSSDTVVLGGFITTTGVDGHSTATATVDVGFLSDANTDGDTDVIDYWVDGHACANSGARATTTLEAMDGLFYPADTLTSTGAATTGYFIACKMITAVGTSAVGNITLSLLLASKNAGDGASAV